MKTGFTDALFQKMKAAVGPGTGFALFLDVGDGSWIYQSNCERSDVVLALEQWLRIVTPSGIQRGPETSEDKDSRLGLERQCVKVGEMLGAATKYGLFFFEFGGKNVAYKTNCQTLQGMVTRWIDRQKNRN